MTRSVLLPLVVALVALAPRRAGTGIRVASACGRLEPRGAAGHRPPGPWRMCWT